MRPLTKTAFLLGRQCPLRLWRHVHGVAEREPDEEEPATDFIAESALVEELAYRLFPGIVRIAPARREDEREERAGVTELLRMTRARIEGAAVPAIAQAFLAADGLLGACDVLVRDGARWRIVEVKASKSVHPLFHHDLAFQWVLAERAGLAISGASVVRLDGEFEHDGAEVRAEALLREEDVTEEVQALLGRTREELRRFLEVVRGPEPDEKPWRRCFASRESKEGNRPSDCGHLSSGGRCHDGLPRAWAWRLPRVRGKKKLELLHSLAEADIRVLDPDDPVGWTDEQRRVIRVVHAGEPEVDASALRQALDRLSYPLAALDFEFDPGVAVPRFRDMRPYERLPFQWSMHVQREPGAPLETPEPFLHLDASDPREGFIESLLAALPRCGSILAHHADAERTVLRHYERWFSGRWAATVEGWLVRIHDTKEIASSGYLHPAQQGSYSIKRLAPALLGHGYEDLELQGGMEAVRAWRRAISGELEADEIARLRAELLAYCGRDTQLLHEVVSTLREFSHHREP